MIISSTFKNILLTKRFSFRLLDFFYPTVYIILQFHISSWKIRYADVSSEIFKFGETKDNLTFTDYSIYRYLYASRMNGHMAVSINILSIFNFLQQRMFAQYFDKNAVLINWKEGVLYMNFLWFVYMQT